MVLKVYNTLTHKKEVFEPLEPPKVRMFVCGLTVYDYAHVGHGKSYTSFDVIARWLRYRGFDVFYLQNVTDIDDKIIARANERKRDPLEFAHEFEAAYRRDIEQLGVKSVNKYARATDHIPEIIHQIERLVKAGYGYEIEEGVYFDITKFEGYGKLSRQNLAELKKARVEPNPNKHNPGDFCLWKKAKPGEPAWNSPWGSGRPGWHIEDTAITEKWLGAQYDLHGGGEDLIFPHHEAEIAQMESLSKKPLVRYWLHNAFIKINGEKMSKSLGNFITLREALAQHSPEVLRYAYLTAHYRDPYDYTLARVEAARTTIQRLRDCLTNLEDGLHHAKAGVASAEVKKQLEEITLQFEQAMDDDFNTPEALKALHALKDYANEYLGSKERTAEGVEFILERFKKLANVLGLLEKTESKLAPGVTEEWILSKIKERQDARKRKDFKAADAIRDELKAKDILLEDTAEGVRWKPAL